MHASLGGLRDVLYNRIRGGFEESACCLQETVLVMAVRGGGGGGGGGRDERPSRTINREELKLEGSERRGGGGEGWGVGGGTCQKRTKGIQDKGDIYTHKVHINQLLFTSTAVLQVSSWVKTKSQNVLKGPRARPFFFFWRADTAERIRHGRRVPPSALFTGLYTHTGAICSVRFTLLQSNARHCVV